MFPLLILHRVVFYIQMLAGKTGWLRGQEPHSYFRTFVFRFDFMSYFETVINKVLFIYLLLIFWLNKESKRIIVGNKKPLETIFHVQVYFWSINETFPSLVRLEHMLSFSLRKHLLAIISISWKSFASITHGNDANQTKKIIAQ